MVLLLLLLLKTHSLVSGVSWDFLVLGGQRLGDSQPSAWKGVSTRPCVVGVMCLLSSKGFQQTEEPSGRASWSHTDKVKQLIL